MDETEEEEVIRQAMSIIGRRKTESKRQASIENGKRGGRPKGTPQSAETREKIRQAKLAQSRPIEDNEENNSSLLAQIIPHEE